MRLSAWFSFFLVLLIVGPSWADAPAPPPECSTDVDCASGQVCSGEFCVAQDEVCASSHSCGSYEVCDFGLDGCPTNCTDNCPERCEVPQGLCITAVAECVADLECAEEEICVAARAPICEDGDSACEATTIFECTVYGRFCDPNEDASTDCFPGDVCNKDGRCVEPHLLEASETITIDPEKDAAARRIGTGTSPSGCSTVAHSPLRTGRVAPLLALLLFSLWRRRRLWGLV